MDTNGIVWRKRIDGAIVECSPEEIAGYNIHDYPGPGEAHADIDGIWYEAPGGIARIVSRLYGDDGATFDRPAGGAVTTLHDDCQAWGARIVAVGNAIKLVFPDQSAIVDFGVGWDIAVDGNPGCACCEGENRGRHADHCPLGAQ